MTAARHPGLLVACGGSRCRCYLCCCCLCCWIELAENALHQVHVPTVPLHCLPSSWALRSVKRRPRHAPGAQPQPPRVGGAGVPNRPQAPPRCSTHPPARRHAQLASRRIASHRVHCVKWAVNSSAGKTARPSSSIPILQSSAVSKRGAIAGKREPSKPIRGVARGAASRPALFGASGGAARRGAGCRSQRAQSGARTGARQRQRERARLQSRPPPFQNQARGKAQNATRLAACQLDTWRALQDPAPAPCQHAHRQRLPRS
jgi:hypothetical protein